MSGSFSKKEMLLGVLASVTVTFGYLGNLQYMTEVRDEPDMYIHFESILTAIGFLVLNSGPYPDQEVAAPVMVQTARFFGVLFVISASVIGLAYLFASSVQPYKIEYYWYKKDKILAERDEVGHVLVCGCGKKGYELAKDAIKKDENVVVIDDSITMSNKQELRSSGAVIFEGDATQQHLLGTKAKSHLAKDVYINCGSDRTNSQVTQTLSDWLEKKGSMENGGEPIYCYTHIQDKKQRHFLHDQIDSNTYLLLHTYSTAQATAREILQRRPVERIESGGRRTTIPRIHVVLIGWTNITQALLDQLLEMMYYPDKFERQITILCRNPESATEEFSENHPALDPNHWSDEITSDFVEKLFPSVEFLKLPKSDTILLSKDFLLYQSIREEDSLTVFVDKGEGFKSASWLTTILPQLEKLEKQHDMGTTVNYFTDFSEGQEDKVQSPYFEFESEHVDIQSFGEFVDECTTEVVKGIQRDKKAKEIACFYYLLYDSDIETEADRWGWSISQRNGTEDEIERILRIWGLLTSDDKEAFMDYVWKELPEKHRDSNRLAADHALTKCRFARSISDSEFLEDVSENIIETLGEMEHRRWCAEKLLAGWEPLPLEKNEQWGDDDQQEVFRKRRFHRDIYPMDKLNEIAPREQHKDISQVKFVLQNICDENNVREGE